jgi:hypothetical protein
MRKTLTLRIPVEAKVELNAAKVRKILGAQAESCVCGKEWPDQYEKPVMGSYRVDEEIMSKFSNIDRPYMRMAALLAEKTGHCMVCLRRK